MKITVKIGGTTHAAKLPYEHAKEVHANVDCPLCGAKAPLAVSGGARRIAGHDTYEANAIARCCDRWVGMIVVKVSTVFGIEEDERVLAGPWRVY